MEQKHVCDVQNLGAESSSMSGLPTTAKNFEKVLMLFSPTYLLLSLFINIRVYKLLTEVFADFSLHSRRMDAQQTDSLIDTVIEEEADQGDAGDEIQT